MNQGHKHAELALQFWAEAAKDAEAWKNWEVKVGNAWRGCRDLPVFSEGNEYRRQPRTITINGIEVPEPVREPLNPGEEYWIVCPFKRELVDDYRWADDSHDTRWLADGIIHRTKEAAIIHTKALLSFTRKEEA